MNKELLIIFIALSVVNVILQTIKSIVTVKGGKWIASFVNALTFAVYTLVTVYTMCDLPLWVKVGIVAVTNFVVFIL